MWSERSALLCSPRWWPSSVTAPISTSQSAPLILFNSPRRSTSSIQLRKSLLPMSLSPLVIAPGRLEGEPQRELNLAARRARPGDLPGGRVPARRVVEDRQVRHVGDGEVRAVEGVENLRPALERARLVAHQVEALDDGRVEGEEPRARDDVAPERPARPHGRQDEDARVEELRAADAADAGDARRE